MLRRYLCLMSLLFGLCIAGVLAAALLGEHLRDEVVVFHGGTDPDDLGILLMDTRLMRLYPIMPDSRQGSFSGETYMGWSHDGTRLAFNSSRKPGLYLADTAGQNRVWLAPTCTGKLVWSPDDRWLLCDTGQNFAGQIDENDHDVWQISAETGARFSLTPDVRTGSMFAAWSPDSRRIAYIEAGWSGGLLMHWLAVVNIDGTGRHRAGSLEFHYSTLLWLADNVRVAYLSQCNGQTGMMIRRVDVFSETCIPVDFSAQQVSTAWSPDRKMAAVAARCGLVIVWLENRDVECLPFDTNGLDAVWSPDSRHVAFTLPPDKPDDPVQLMLYDAVTGDSQLIYQAARTLFFDRMAWSPDGILLTFTPIGYSTESSKVHLMNLVTGEVRMIKSYPPFAWANFVGW